MGSDTRATSHSGLVDLGTELTCSICTDLLYQPLTLLDCLHTFCGSCLKSWFSWQASGSPTRNQPRFTCPACRATVRDTRHDAKVNTLLDLFLQSNPTKVKSSEEKEEVAKEYKPGEPVLPPPPPPDQIVLSTSEEEDNELLQEVRERSLRDLDRPRLPRESFSRGRSDRSPAERAREQRLEDARRRRRTERRMNASPQMRNLRNPSPDTRRIEHQSSLRSLLGYSAHESDIEDEILRQIAEEGLLDGVDLHSLTAAQEDELTERIAQAFRRRHLERSVSRNRSRRPSPPTSTSSSSATVSDAQATTSTTVAAAATTATTTTTTTAPTTLSIATEEGQPRTNRNAARQTSERDRPSSTTRSRLLDPSSANNPSSGHRRRSSEQGARQRRQTSPTPESGSVRSSDAPTRPSLRSTRDSSARRHSTNPSLSTPAPNNRRASASTNAHSPSPGRRPASSSRTPRQSSNQASPEVSTTHLTSPTSTLTPSSTPQALPIRRPAEPLSQSTPNPVSQPRIAVPEPTVQPASPPLPSSTPIVPQATPEPSISCERCGKNDIQYELHKYCKLCKEGNYSLCLRCFRQGRGCSHWFGFGDAAQYYYDKKISALDVAAAEALGPPHVLYWRRYLRLPEGEPSNQAGEDKSTAAKKPLLEPSERLQTGMFCDMCQAHSDDCFWKCADCNDNEWGFCNSCVNQDKCCTHPLFPITRLKDTTVPIRPLESQMQQPQTINNSPAAPAQISVPDTFLSEYAALRFSTKCNICTYPIPPSVTRFHCPECNGGDYDICTNCYLKLGASGKISKDNGRNGWRRCLQGHRMVIIGLEDHEDGQRRIIVQGLVGGHSWEHFNPSSPTNSSQQQQLVSSSQSADRWTWSEPSSQEGGGGGSSGVRLRRRLNRYQQQGAGMNAVDNNSSNNRATQDAKLALGPRFPPSGGLGLRVVARWAYYPEPDDKDEIMFPRGAEISEAENINDDWMYGCYAGQVGVFPG
ncbi:hypothetical protein FQN57_002585, partial [Myotisia sp. PD_48]